MLTKAAFQLKALISACSLSGVLLLSGCAEPETATSASSEPLDPVAAAQQELLSKGRIRAASCAACHGPQGISNNPMYPSLAGQDENHLLQSMLAYRSGEKVNALMSPQARSLSDQDIALLAAYYAALPGQ
ncbi:c-type cytochrome [Alkalimonas sp. MEB108]|uniref:C-type cytochrome n=1 Tax=Alkalimonas cellulosilytica TaxID=3058395 RepID=A0ABU7JA89_9GAMM|nr:c-type cytochrome [Alkalimonas sp. MEB108]MEE2002902.1 c-type cytochrome [Alkalimonas sp. MEB108]